MVPLPLWVRPSPGPPVFPLMIAERGADYAQLPDVRTGRSARKTFQAVLNVCVPQVMVGFVPLLAEGVKYSSFPTVVLESALFPPKGLITIQPFAKGDTIATFAKNDSRLRLLL